MRPFEMLFQIINDHTPMDKAEKDNLKDDAARDYSDLRNKFFDDVTKKRKDVTAITWKEKVVVFSEKWETRTVCALVFIVINKWLKSWLHSEDEFEDDYEEDDYDDDEEYDD